MGSEDLHHKRKAKREKEHQRNAGKRKSYERVLIVCEGEKTEPFYFEELRDYYELATANVKVDGSCDSSPKSVYEHAVKLFKTAKAQGNAYDRVYCVFDKDRSDNPESKDKNTYQSTLENIRRQKQKDTFFAINSVPCFEYWLILHFEFTTRPYAASKNRSIGGMVEKHLKQYIPDYEKKDHGVFKKLIGNLDTAKINAKRSLEAAERDNTDNPSTRVHELVDYLQNLKKPRE